MTRAEVEVLYRKYGPLVHRRARTLLRSDEDAADAVQEIFIRALGGGAAFDGRSQASTWLYQITTNWCLNRIRDRNRRQELWDSHTGSDVFDEAPTMDPSRLVLVRGLLAEAEEQQATAAIYVFVDGMSHDEAADVLGVSRRTVGNLVERFVTWGRSRLAERSTAVVPS